MLAHILKAIYGNITIIIENQFKASANQSIRYKFFSFLLNLFQNNSFDAAVPRELRHTNLEAVVDVVHQSTSAKNLRILINTNLGDHRILEHTEFEGLGVKDKVVRVRILDSRKLFLLN